MAVYLLITYDIKDPEGFEPYAPAVIPLLHKHNVEILAGDFEPKTLEGDKRGVAVVLKFQSESAVTTWYNDPEYAPMKKLRLDTTINNSIYMAKEFVP